MRTIPIFLILILWASLAWGFRVQRPPTLTLPLDQSQISQLNRYLEDIWKLQQGEFNLDIVTTSKTNSQNGDFWIIRTGAMARIQYKSGDHIFTIQP